MHSFRKHALTVALGLALSTGSAFAVAAPASQAVAVAHATALQSGDVVTGALSISHSLHVTIALNLRNESQLDAAIAQHHVMSQQQFLDDYAPTAA